MADNLTTQTTVATVPSGSVIATDDAGGVHFQKVKLVDGTDGSTALIGGDATNGLDVDVTRLPALPAGNNNIGDVDVASIAAGDNNIGNVDIVTMPNVTLNEPVTVDGAVVVEGDAAHGAVDAGDPVKIGGKANGSTPAFVDDGDRVDAWFEPMGSQVVTLADDGGVTVQTGSGTAASALRVNAATNSPDVVSLAAIESDMDALRISSQLIDDSVQVLGTDTYSEATSKGITLGAVRRDADTTLVNNTNEFTPLQTDANGRLKVEAFSGETLPTSLATLPALVAGSANIGDVDVLSVPAPLSTTGTGTEATAQRVTIATDSTGLLSVDDNGSSLSVDWNGTQPVTGSGNATGALRVELANNGTGLLSTVSTVTAVTAITNPVTVAGGAAHASPVSGNPNLTAGRASTAIPTDVGADGDTASFWTNRNGATVVLQAPHVGLNSDPWNLLHEGNQYTTAQTSAVLVAGGAGDKIVVTQCQIQAFGTTAGTVIVYFGTGAFSRGTNRTIFDGEFKPSTTLAPGAILNGPFISGANGDDILVTSVGDIDITVSCWYYIVT